MKQNIDQQLDNALGAGNGILHLAPTWVPRTFVMPGKRMRLAPEDLYALGVDRGGIDERWFASTIHADNGPGTLEDEGLSYVVGPDGDRFLLRDAVESAGERVIGRQMMQDWGRWPVLCKFFDNMGPIPHHLHHDREHAAQVGAEPKPEAYYFPRQLNPVGNSFPYTFFGLEPGTGWLIPPGILHAPGSLCTYEVQWGSDVLAMFQSMVEERPVPWDLLVKDVPQGKKDDLDYIIGLIGWDANVTPTFKQDHYLTPRMGEDTTGAGYEDRWIIYGKIHGENLFSARELSVEPGASAIIRDGGPSGVTVIQGQGRLGSHSVGAPTLVRYGELTWDEFFITAEAAAHGLSIENTGHEPLVLLRYFGPGAGPDVSADDRSAM